MLKEVVVELGVKRNTIYPRSKVLMPTRLVDPRGFEPLTF